MTKEKIECDICGKEIPEMLQKINRAFADEPCYCNELNEVTQKTKQQTLRKVKELDKSSKDDRFMQILKVRFEELKK